MGTQSITHPSRSSYAPLRIVYFLLLFVATYLSASAQTSARTVPLILPSAIVFDAAGNLYFAESGNHVVRRVDATGQITTIAGTGTQGFTGDAGPATSAALDSPLGLALDSANHLYIADTHNDRIRKLDLVSGILTTIAGTGTRGFFGDAGPAAAAELNLPAALACDTANNLYVADTGNHRIRRIDAASGVITTIAGTGAQGFSGDNALAEDASLDSPDGLVVDAASNLYLADTHNQRIRRIDATTGIIRTIAGTGAQGFAGDAGNATSATLALPHGITLDAAGNLYLADTDNHRIRRIDAVTGIITTVAGDGTQAFAGDGSPAIAASLDTPRSTAVSPTALLTLADSGNQRIRQLTAVPAPVTTIRTIAGLGLAAPGALTLSAPTAIPYGTGQLTATLASTTPINGVITFVDTTNSSTLGTANLIANIATVSTTMLSAGLHAFSATYAGDQTYLPAVSPPLAISVTPQQLTATVIPVTILYGQPISVITGTLNGVLPQDAANLTAAFTTVATALSSAGTYPIVVALTGSGAANYTIAATPATVTINPAPVLITLSNLIATATAGSFITLTAHIATSTSGTPTGSVTLLDGANSVYTAPLSSTGDAIFTIPSIAQGSHSYTAVYSGSGNFTGGTSSPQLVTVGTGGPPSSADFVLSSTGTTTQTIVSGGSASYTFAVQLQGAMSSPIALAATGLPNLSTASFNPPALPPGSTANTFTLTIATPKTTTSQNRSRSPIVWALLVFPLAGFSLFRRNRHTVAKFFAIMLVSATLLFANGCGDRVNASGALALSTKSYTITVTGTSTTGAGGILQHSATVTLLLEQPQ
ncbi:MAG: Ig-like domain repeat protein [Edaphobacter sp.]